MDDNTFILLYRKTIESRVFRNEGLLKVWVWCLLKASYKERWVTMKTGKSEIEIKILPGQFVYGRLSAGKELNMKPSTVRNRMKKLENMQNVDIKEDRQYSIISIINWDSYQNDKYKEDIKEDNQRTTKGQPKDTNKKVNKVNKEENKDTPPLPPRPIFKKYLQEKIIENNFIESKDKIFEFYQYRMDMPKSKRYKTEKGINGLFRDLNGCRDAGLIASECLEIAMEKGWQTPGPDYFKNGSNMQNMHNGQQSGMSTGDQWIQMRRDRENANK